MSRALRSTFAMWLCLGAVTSGCVLPVDIHFACDAGACSTDAGARCDDPNCSILDGGGGVGGGFGGGGGATIERDGGVYLSESFNGAWPGLWIDDERTYGDGGMAIDFSAGLSGSAALRVYGENSDANGAMYRGVNYTFNPPLPPTVYLRVFLRTASVNVSPDAKLLEFFSVVNDGGVQFSEGLFVRSRWNGMTLHTEELQKTGDSIVSLNAQIVGQWADHFWRCVEWRLDGTVGSATVKVGNSSPVEMSIERFPGLSVLRLELYTIIPFLGPAREVWFDELIVASHRVPCVN
jgi:hypothetical protein